MRTKSIALIIACALLAGLVPAMAASAHASDLPQAGHHCCPKMAKAELPTVLAPLPLVPNNPGHSCCTVRLPAKLPSASTGISRDGQIFRVIERNIRVAHAIIQEPSRSNNVLSLPLELSTVIRI